MEPFFVADTLCAYIEHNGIYNIFPYGILYTDVPFTWTDYASVSEVLIFTNSENNCYVSFYHVNYQEQFIVPAKSYYVICDSTGVFNYTSGLHYLVRRGSNELPNVRIFYRQTKESVFLKNINVREYVF